jgi:hypothetical protein
MTAPVFEIWQGKRRLHEMLSDPGDAKLKRTIQSLGLGAGVFSLMRRDGMKGRVLVRRLEVPRIVAEAADDGPVFVMQQPAAPAPAVNPLGGLDQYLHLETVLERIIERRLEAVRRDIDELRRRLDDELAGDDEPEGDIYDTLAEHLAGMGVPLSPEMLRQEFPVEKILGMIQQGQVPAAPIAAPMPPAGLIPKK